MISETGWVHKFGFPMLGAALIACLAFSGRAFSEGGKQALYDSVRQGDTVTDMASVLRQEGGRTLLEVSLLTKGQGAETRRWVPEKPYLLLGSDRVQPARTSHFYAEKPSAARPLAVIVFAAIGSQYEGCAAEAQSTPGKACSVSGSGGQGGASEAINRVGMAASMGLLASQAKGEIKGTRATFDLTDLELKEKLRLKFEIANAAQKKRHDVTAPLPFEPEPRRSVLEDLEEGQVPLPVNVNGESQDQIGQSTTALDAVATTQPFNVQRQVTESVETGDVLLLPPTPPTGEQAPDK